jgi:hypothetical protein
MNPFLGLPPWLWGLLCLGLTAVWVVVYPRPLAARLSGWRFIVIRWFHALTWLLLAVAAFLAAFNPLGGAALAQPVALASLGVYVVFMLTMAVGWRSNQG